MDLLFKTYMIDLANLPHSMLQAFLEAEQKRGEAKEGTEESSGRCCFLRLLLSAYSFNDSNAQGNSPCGIFAPCCVVWCPKLNSSTSA